MDPLYVEQPPTILNKVDAIGRDVFAEKYNLLNKGVAPKCLKYGIHLDELDMEAVFGPKGEQRLLLRVFRRKLSNYGWLRIKGLKCQIRG